MNKVKLLIFDLTGVIADTIHLHLKAYKKVFSEYGIFLPEDEIYRRLGPHPEDVIKGVFSEAGIKGGYKEAATKKMHIYDKLLKNTKVISKRTIKAIQKLGKKYKLALLTSTNRKEVYEILPPDILNILEFICTCEDCKKLKPDPYGLLLIARNLGLNPEECVYIGDMRIDMIAAKKAKMHALGISRENKMELIDVGAEHVFNSLDEMYKYFAGVL